MPKRVNRPVLSKVESINCMNCLLIIVVGSSHSGFLVRVQRCHKLPKHLRSDQQILFPAEPVPWWVCAKHCTYRKHQCKQAILTAFDAFHKTFFHTCSDIQSTFNCYLLCSSRQISNVTVFSSLWRAPLLEWSSTQECLYICDFREWLISYVG